MRNATRQDVVQALGTLGVRLSGVVERAHFEDAVTQALAGVRALQIECHPDRHANRGEAVTKLATARFQLISFAEHFLRGLSWAHVAGMFAARVSRSTSEKHWSTELWGTVPTRPGARYYQRCPMCQTLVQAGERHTCKLNVDHFNTKSRPFSYERPWKSDPPGPAEPPPHPKCGHESPMGVTCAEPMNHEGWHRGFGKKGRHTWRETSLSIEEKVRVEKPRRGT